MAVQGQADEGGRVSLVPLPATVNRPPQTPVRATYTVPEIAALLGVSPATVYVMLRQGAIPARRAGARWIIARRRFDEWLDGVDNALPGGMTGVAG